VGPHESHVSHVFYSPDGKLLACSTAAAPRVIHPWGRATGKEVAVLRGHTTSMRVMGFSPHGSRLVSSGNYPDSTAWLWDVAAGKLLARLSGHKNRIVTAEFSPDGRRLVTGSYDQTARLCNARTGQLLAVLGGHSRSVRLRSSAPVVGASLPPRMMPRCGSGTDKKAT
jgi:WD40 repeat protein